MAVFTGMRKGEVLNLEWSNIKLALGLFYVEHTESSRIREIPIAASVREILWNSIKKCNSEYVFADKEEAIQVLTANYRL